MLIPTLLALILCNSSPYITSAQALENAIPRSIKHFWKFRSEKISTLQHQNYISLTPHRDLILFPWKVLLNSTESKAQSSNLYQGLMPAHQRKISKNKLWKDETSQVIRLKWGKVLYRSSSTRLHEYFL